MSFKYRFLNFLLKKKAKTITESKNKQKKVTAKYITQKRQEKKKQNVRKQKKKGKEKTANKGVLRKAQR